MNEEARVAVSIVRFVDQHQPNIIEFVLRDAFQRDRHFRDKVTIVSLLDLDERSTYPVEGWLRCTVLRRYEDEHGRALAVIDTAHPDSVESLDEEHVFTIALGQLVQELSPAKRKFAS